jgi:signal transduction histidine kinase
MCAVVLNILRANIHMHNTEKADYYLRRYAEINAQYSEKSFHNTVSELDVRYETEKKEMRISSLEQQKKLYVFIGIAGLLLAFALWTVYHQKIRSERKEKQLVAAHATLVGGKKERMRLARDLHDGLGGMLSAIKLGLADDERLQGVRRKIDYCIEELTRLAHHLMPASLSRFGLKAALEDYCRLFPNVRFHFFGEDRRMDEKIELTVYYCAYELVNNAVKYAAAEHIDVQLILDGDRVSLTVQDDGCGFDETQPAQGTGLKNIGDRVTAFNGKMDVTASPGNGSETIIELKTENF